MFLAHQRGHKVLIAYVAQIFDLVQACNAAFAHQFPEMVMTDGKQQNFHVRYTRYTKRLVPGVKGLWSAYPFEKHAHQV